MGTREITLPWSNMQEGDTFVRYTQQGGMRRLIVKREVPDLPTKKGTIGYGTVERSGALQDEVLLVRAFEVQDHPHGWVCPLENGDWHTTQDAHIVEFREIALTPAVLPGDLRDAVRNALDSQPLPSRASLVDDVVERIIALYSKP